MSHEFSRNQPEKLLVSLAAKMNRTKLLKISPTGLFAILAILLLTSTFPSGTVEKLSMDMVSKKLYQGKSVTVNGAVYYKSQGGLMITRITYPFEQITVVNGLGEFKNYDPKSNTVTLMQGADLSSKSSFIYSFLSGRTNDLGITDMGFKLQSTKVDKGIVVQTYAPKTDMVQEAQKVEIALENNLPIFVGFFGADGAPISKTYYTNFQNVSYLKMPLTITEIDYLAPNDSSITKRIYSNLKLNADVSNEWINYQIPSTARVLKPESTK